ncbi:MAG: GntR family transcriptional regulator [Alphaproteobacteria bacterium]|nr:GntR family transcriptional regulator [Alphaproteobacteria bacterium]
MSAQRSYRDIQEEVLRRIGSREWGPGDLIPSEIALAEEFNCARATINRALRELAEKGHLDRKRRAGTRVALTPVRQAIFDIPITRIEVEESGRAYRHLLLRRALETAPAPVYAALGLDADRPLLHVTAVHLADRQPFLYEDRWINTDAVPGVADADFSSLSANEWLVRNALISRGDLSFSAEAATPADADALGTTAGKPLFVIHRTTWIGATPVTAVRLAHAPGYQLTTTI